MYTYSTDEIIQLCNVYLRRVPINQRSSRYGIYLFLILCIISISLECHPLTNYIIYISNVHCVCVQCAWIYF